MNFKVTTGAKEMAISVTVKTESPQEIRLKVYDYDKPKTYFTDRTMVVDGTAEFVIMMPITPERIMVSVYNEKNGNRYGKMEEDKTFLCDEKSIKRVHLKKKLNLIPYKTVELRSFIDFCERFCLNSSYMEPGRYRSDDSRYYIDFFEEIRDPAGKTIGTPARIEMGTGKIEVSKKSFDQYTMPMRMAIMLHEYSHFYVNENMTDESEADLNGLLIYLSLGFPRIEAHQAWLEVFTGAPSEANKARYEMIETFINDFENNKIR